MKYESKNPPRTFITGDRNHIAIADVGDIFLTPGEMITFVTEQGARYDLAAKGWGFYATPSVNSRLKNEGFKTALVRNELGRIYIMVVEKNQLEAYKKFCEDEKQTVLQWLDEIPETAL